MTFPGDARRARLGITPLTIDGPALVRVKRSGTCGICGGAEYTQLDAHRTGYSCGTTYDCMPTCSNIVCPHGLRWDVDEGCEPCAAADEAAIAANAEEADYAEEGDF